MGIDTSVRVASTSLRNPVMTASGTSGHGAELGTVGDLSTLGAVVVKSLAAFPWAGNPGPRVHALAHGMINAVGLQGSGILQWAEKDLIDLSQQGAVAIISMWGRTIDEYRTAAEQVQMVLDASPHANTIAAVEVNLSCPNIDGHGIFAHDLKASAEVVATCRSISRPLWVKLSPNTDRIVQTAGVVREAGAQAVTLVNTISGLMLDPRTGTSVLGHGQGGGVSGRLVHPVAVKAVHDVYEAFADLAIIGVGGVASAWDAAELMLAGASAVQVGTATFADPRAPFRIARDLEKFGERQGLERLSDLTGLAHRGGFR